MQATCNGVIPEVVLAWILAFAFINELTPSKL